MSDHPSAVPHIVIVGGGAGGLVLATRLGNRYGRSGKLRITLVDAQLTHIWKPLLHEVAAGSLNPYEDEVNYFGQAQRHGFSFQPGRMIAIDRERQRIRLDEMQDEHGKTVLETRDLSYDFLVVAIGSTANDFGTAGAREHCIYLDTRDQAERFHRALLNCYYRAKARGEAGGGLDVAIIGAGATGVELAAEIHHAAKALAKYGLDEIRPTDVRISVIEAADRILPALTPRVAGMVHRSLEKLGVAVLTGEKVTAIDESGIDTASGKRIPAQLRVWSAGIKAPDFLNGIAGLESARGNTLVVDGFLRTTRDARIFALGDCAACTLKAKDGSEIRLPPRAQSAYQQAQWLAGALPELIAGRTPSPFAYRDRGSLVSLSKETAVGQLMGNLTGDLNVEGRIARLMYVSLYRMHQAALHGWLRTLVFMLKDVIARSTGPKLKLH
ncbi:MAG: NAD(P)/FAD-dependent oxidoreductase [Pseudomonadota bacterium]